MKGLVLVSGGIDSPVAAYMMMKQGVEVGAIHFSNEPFTDQKQELKAKEHMKKLAAMFNVNIPFFIAMHGKVQAEFARNADRRYQCVFCRRIMLRVAERIAKEKGYDFLITGENLGQVASQTLPNMAAITKAVGIGIMRPLLCNDKVETIKIAKEIGTFETSIGPGVCCNLVPQNPVTKARLHSIEINESKIDIEELIKKEISDMKEELILP